MAASLQQNPTERNAMKTQLYVNLPVKDLKRSVEFFTALGFTFNPKFTDENATCMIIGENVSAMLLVEDFFKSFTKKEINDPRKTPEVILAVSVESRALVEDLMGKAVKAGATPSEAKDYGFMYQHGFQDLDGHLWEVFYMDEAAMAAQQQSQQK
jgi:predicted lactoylglutathione lyase